MTECRSQGGVPAPISRGLIDVAVFAYVDDHRAAATKVPGDLEANVAPKHFGSAHPCRRWCMPDQMKVEIDSPSLSLYLTSAMDTLPSPGWVP
jgi:hypothetical protein